MPRGRGSVLGGDSGGQDSEMTVDFKGWNVEYYAWATSPGRGNSRRGRPGFTLHERTRVTKPVVNHTCNSATSPARNGCSAVVEPTWAVGSAVATMMSVRAGVLVLTETHACRFEADLAPIWRAALPSAISCMSVARPPMSSPICRPQSPKTAVYLLAAGQGSAPRRSLYGVRW